MSEEKAPNTAADWIHLRQPLRRNGQPMLPFFWETALQRTVIDQFLPHTHTVYIGSSGTDRDTTTLHQRLIEIEIDLLHSKMSKEQQLRLRGHGGNDEEHVHRGDEESDEENADINEISEATIKKSRGKDTSLGVSSDLIHMIDTFDRQASANTEGGYAKQGFYASGFENKPGKRIPKAGYIAEAGIGRARAEASIFEAEAKGPNASAAAEASVVKLGAIARAEIASASAKAGPLGVKVGLGLDTGASAGVDGVEVKVLGTGFTIGPKINVSVLGSEASCSVM